MVTTDPSFPPRELFRLTLTVDADGAELLSYLLALHVAHGWQEDALPSGETRAVIHAENPAFLDAVQQAVLLRLPMAQHQRDSIPDQPWALAWRDFFTPVEAGDRFTALAPWMETERAAVLAAGRTPVIIEPKTAFGTGHHASTALCLTAISDLMDQGRIKAGMRFLDLGTGSGILAIACARLGLTGVGLDVDMLAVENALENAAINGISTEGKDAALQFARGSLSCTQESFDLILANILAAPLKEMAARITARLADGACLVLSGILGEQAEDVAAAYRNQGMGVPLRKDQDEWAALIWS